MAPPKLLRGEHYYAVRSTVQCAALRCRDVGGVFINYRRHPDRTALIGALYEQLSGRFGSSNVFLDVTSVHPGERYPNRLRRHLDRSDVVIAVVHDGWVRDLRDGRDWVREEIEIAFAEGKTIIPLLLPGTAMPTASDLPRSIREFAHLQAHTIQDGHDFGALLDEIGDPAQRSATVPQTPRRRWSGVLACCLATAAFVLPVALWPRDERELAVYASAFGVMVLFAALVATGLVALARRQINATEQLVHDVGPTRYHLWMGLPLSTLLIVFTSALVFSSPVDPALGAFLVVAIGFSIMYTSVLIIRQYREEQHREDNWPVRLRAPVRAAPVRRELERLRRKLPTGDERRIRWHVRHLENAADALARDASRGRWSWLTADAPLILLGYAVWTATIVGLMTAAALPTMRLWVPAATLVIVAVLVGLTVELAFRRQRWVRHQVADEVHLQVQRLLDAR